MSWTWIYQNEDGSPSPALPAEAVVTPFPTQADAEAYIHGNADPLGSQAL